MIRACQQRSSCLPLKRLSDALDTKPDMGPPGAARWMRAEISVWRSQGGFGLRARGETPSIEADISGPMLCTRPAASRRRVPMRSHTSRGDWRRC